MRMSRLGILLLTFPMLFFCACNDSKSNIPSATSRGAEMVSPSILKLPTPKLDSEKSLEQCLFERRSIREYADLPLSLEDVSQLLWAGQGITSDWGGRTAPSAGALYPLEVYLVVGNVDRLEAGVYRYKPEGHELVRLRDGDIRKELAEAALSQAWVEEGAINIIIAAVYERTTVKYGERGETYVHMEAGHAAQNIYLQATALNLGTVTIGAFYDNQIKKVLHMADGETPLYIMPIGKKI